MEDRKGAFNLTKNFTAKDATYNQTSFLTEKTAGNCSTLEESQFTTCANFQECEDIPEGGSFLTYNTTSFVAIYSSIGGAQTFKFRGTTIKSAYFW